MAEEALTTGFAIAWPWLLLLAPVPWLLRFLMPASPSGDLQALRVPWFSAVAGGKAGWMRRPLAGHDGRTGLVTAGTGRVPAAVDW